MPPSECHLLTLTPRYADGGLNQNGIKKVCGIAGISAEQIEHILHGTTVATNAGEERGCIMWWGATPVVRKVLRGTLELVCLACLQCWRGRA